jgi:hypothetical protein
MAVKLGGCVISLLRRRRKQFYELSVEKAQRNVLNAAPLRLGIEIYFFHRQK